ncbi:MAG: DNA replication/repair protein RecF [Pseudomonadota bacterium]
MLDSDDHSIDYQRLWSVCSNCVDGKRFPSIPMEEKMMQLVELDKTQIVDVNETNNQRDLVSLRAVAQKRTQGSFVMQDSVDQANASFRSLLLNDYRSYASIRLAFDGRPVAFFGANGAGKTNLLEALSLFAPGRGLRGARLQELPRAMGAGGWAASAMLSRETDDLVKLGVGAAAHKPDKRLCRIDEKTAKGPSAFSDYVRFLWLTPAQDGLFVAAAGERRKFLDRMTQARDAAHARAASEYETAMRQRQKLLDDGVSDDAWLRALETKMAEAGVAVAAARLETRALLSDADTTKLSDGAFPAADIRLEGKLEDALGEKPAADVEDDYINVLRNNRRIDREAGRATMGPHRSDMIVSHRPKQMPARLCSTGEQKALLIGLVLANACILADSGARAPLVLLLDEIAAHLDTERRAALFDIIESTRFQCFMTGTDISLFSAWGARAQAFRVGDGKITETTL